MEDNFWITDVLRDIIRFSKTNGLSRVEAELGSALVNIEAEIGAHVATSNIQDLGNVISVDAFKKKKVQHS